MNDILEFAIFLAEAAEGEVMSRFRNCVVNWKPDGSEVTDADRGAEERIRELIEKKMPGHLVLGEEFGGPAGPTNEPLWVIDPIDGTASFALGLPTFGTLIGYLQDGEPFAGVMHFPAMGETVYAAKGSGCWARVRGAAATQVRAAKTASIKDGYISTSSVDSGYNLNTLISKPRKFRFINDCVQHALVAQGRIDVAVDPVMKPWDIAAIVPCIEEADGVVTDLEGRRERIVWRSSLLSTCTRSLHDEVLRTLKARELS